jgi:V/A-type H+-transporting ATPase subunit C
MARELDFLYASARIKALETKLLGKSTIDRILEADGAEEALKVLSDTDYGSDIAEMNNIYDFEKVLLNSMKRSYKAVEDSLKDSRYIRFFTLKQDYHNLKVLFKSKILNTSGSQYFSPLGKVPLEEMEKLTEEDASALVPESIKNAYRSAVNAYETTQDPQQIDLVLDKALYEELDKLVKSTKSAMLKSYFEALVDLTNIKTLIRLMQMKADIRLLERALLPGGAITKDTFEKLYGEPVQTIVDSFASSTYQKVVEVGLSSWSNTGSLAVYERLADDYLLNLARKGLYKPFGEETVIGYLAAKENEAKILRILLVGKINRIPTEMIKERLRDVYV